MGAQEHPYPAARRGLGGWGCARSHSLFARRGAGGGGSRSQATEAESRARPCKHAPNTTHSHARGNPERSPPEQQPRPRRCTRPPDRQSTCAHSLQPDTPSPTHGTTPRNGQTGAANHVRTHTSSSRRKHGQPSEGATCAHSPPRPRSVTSLRPAARRSPAARHCLPQPPSARGTGTLPQALPPSAGYRRGHASSQLRLRRDGQTD
nr:serine/arginine repetitive matrix protein 3-like [Cavia porcellus]